MSIRSWKVLDSQYVLTDPWMTVRSDQCETDQGVVVNQYFVHESCDWVHVVAFNEHNEVLLTRQYRHAAAEILYELPAGCVDKDESPLAAIERELLEETGCIAEHYVALPPQLPNPARCNNKVHPYVALGVHQITSPAQEPSENIEFLFVPIPTLLQMIETGEFKASMHISAVYMGLTSQGLLPYSGLE